MATLTSYVPMPTLVMERHPEGALLQGRGIFEMAPDTDIRRADPVDEAHDRLYTVYNEEAEKYDTALTGRLKTGTESLLIFAGLFSATVTALLIESYPMLTVDSGDIMVFYLAQITQQLATMSPGQTQNMAVPIPLVFEPTPSAVRINILWVLSLIFSLACALGATLIQTWTNRYTRLVGRFAPPTHRALQRQFFFEGIKESQLIAIAEGLPALLHISLFLFLAGLIEFFLPINQDVAHAILIIVIVIAVVYAVLTVSPLIVGKSPYRTPLTPHFPRRVVRLCQHIKDRYFQMLNPAHDPEILRHTSILLRKTRALQWLLNQTTGVRNFDSFVDGIEPFLDNLPGNATVIYQLNVGDASSMEARSTFTLAAHIGYRLHSCVDNSNPGQDAIRSAQAVKYTKLLWLLFGHVGDRLSLLNDGVAPGGIALRDHWCPTTTHMQQWLNKDVLRSLRRLRSYPYVTLEVALYANCASAVIANHLVRGLCSVLQDSCQFRVPKSWGILKLLAHCDALDEDHDDADWSTCYELDALTTCLLDPLISPAGSILLSRADGDLRNYLVLQKRRNVPFYRVHSSSEFPHNPQHLPTSSLHSLSLTHIENTCRLAVLNGLLSFVSDQSATSHTIAATDAIQETILLLADGLSASNAEPSAQQAFVDRLEGVIDVRRTYPSPLLSSLAADAVIPILRTLDDPTSSLKARELNREQLDIDTNATYGVRSNIGIKQLELTVSQTNKIVFGSLSLQVRALEDIQWRFARVDEYWTLQHIATGMFLGLDTIDVSGPPVLSASTGSAQWDVICAESSNPHHRTSLTGCKFFYQDTQYSINFGQHPEVEAGDIPLVLSEMNSPSPISFDLIKMPTTPINPPIILQVQATPTIPPARVSSVQATPTDPPLLVIAVVPGLMITEAEIRARANFYSQALNLTRRYVGANTDLNLAVPSAGRASFGLDEDVSLGPGPSILRWDSDRAMDRRGHLGSVVSFQEVPDELLNNAPSTSNTGDWHSRSIGDLVGAAESSEESFHSLPTHQPVADQGSQPPVS